MSDLVNRLRAAQDEIDRLKRRVKGDGYVIDMQQDKLKRLQDELDASHTNNLILAEENLSQEKEIERLRKDGGQLK